MVALDDLAIITVSTNEAHWLRPCLSTVFDHLGDIRADVVVVDNESHDETSQLVATEFPDARVVRCQNHGKLLIESSMPAPGPFQVWCRYSYDSAMTYT